MREETIPKIVIRILEGLLVSPLTEMKTIEAMPIEEVKEQLKQMHLDPDQPLPPKIRELIFNHRQDQQQSTDTSKLTYTVLRKIINRKRSVQPGSPLTEKSQTFAGNEAGKVTPDKRNPRIRSWSFEDGDAIYKKGIAAFKEGRIEPAIEFWREAKLIFLCVDLKKQIAACDRNIGIALQKLGKSEQALQPFKRAKRIYLGIGLKEQVASCEAQIATAYRELSGHS